MQDRVMATSIRRIRVASLSGVGRRLWEGRSDWKMHGRSGGGE